MEERLKLPIGIEHFEEMRRSHFYYVDKTKIIEQLLENQAKVTLFTRPRRFGKTLTMSMLKSFFEIGTGEGLFDGLYISENKEFCKEYMGKYPVIFLSLKGVEGLNFEEARRMLGCVIRTEAERHYVLKNSTKVTLESKILFEKLLYTENENLVDSLRLLSQLLFQHYGRKTIILIDEYDVPLEKAFQHGYYKEMISLLRGFMGQALKTNEFLQFAVLTGCLRISKESIFTGLNNFKVLSITDVRFDEQFGFTDSEVKEILKCYDLDEHFKETKEWYAGYHFGNTEVYCPWDVLNHIDYLRWNNAALPQSYWINSSGNDLVKRFVEKADKTTRDEIEQLIEGDSVKKKIMLDLTYDELDKSIDHMWSVLFTTGYLTMLGREENGIYELIIPNKELREVFVLQIQQWFEESIAKDDRLLNELYNAFLQGKSAEIQKHLTKVLGQTISILDTKARDEEKEIFYHGLLLGLLRNCGRWSVKSNVESGDGFVDILLKPEDPDIGIIIELKYTKNFMDLEKACKKAQRQIKDLRYGEALCEEGRCEILAYSIAFCKKRCKVDVEKLDCDQRKK